MSNATLPRHTASNLKAARRLATKLYGRRSKLYLYGDSRLWSVLVRAEDGETNLAYIHLDQGARA